MERDFDKVIDRHNTDCAKYDFAAEYGKPEELLPLWVADMDFQAPKVVTEKLEEMIAWFHKTYGVALPRRDCKAARKEYLNFAKAKNTRQGRSARH